MKKKLFAGLVVLICVIEIVLILTANVSAESSFISRVDPADSYTYMVTNLSLTCPYSWLDITSLVSKLSYTFYNDGQLIGANSSIPANKLAVTYTSDMGEGYETVSFTVKGDVYCNNKKIYVFQTQASDFNLSTTATCFFDLSETIPNSTQAHYNFATDRWSFENLNETIAKKYYTRILGEAKGDYFYSAWENGSPHGHCFGMAVSTSSILQGSPSVSKIVKSNGDPFDFLVSVGKYSRITTLGVTLSRDFIKYCHVYQASSYIQTLRNKKTYTKGIRNVYNAVEKATRNGKVSDIAIDMWGGPGGHTVYAVGVQNGNILINDSNEPDTIQTIRVNGSSWSYSGGGWTWDRNNGCTINYVNHTQTPYVILTTNPNNVKKKIRFAPVNTGTDGDEENELPDDYTELPIDTDKLLFICDPDAVTFDQNDQLIPITRTEVAASSDDPQMYWLTDSTIQAKNRSDTATTIELIGNTTGIHVTAAENTETTVCLNEDDKSSVSVTSDEEKPFMLSFDDYDEDGVKRTVAIFGTSVLGNSTDDAVSVDFEDGSIQVSNLNDLSISYYVDDDKQMTVDAAVTDGRTVQITVDEDHDSISTDYAEDDSTSDQTGEKCQYCDTVHPNNFIGRITKFIHSVLYFFAHLFGKM